MDDRRTVASHQDPLDYDAIEVHFRGRAQERARRNRVRGRSLVRVHLEQCVARIHELERQKAELADGLEAGTVDVDTGFRLAAILGPGTAAGACAGLLLGSVTAGFLIALAITAFTALVETSARGTAARSHGLQMRPSFALHMTAVLMGAVSVGCAAFLTLGTDAND